ncbi:MAG: 4'-phosphopantetheinyl transferase superfamily protein [Candidatus Electrothrix sp. Rat3]|nr:4'-phosphopantetheinyl transferase superfamily protein [Candidatus Electrothrix rattekaaiensis]
MNIRSFFPDRHNSNEIDVFLRQEGQQTLSLVDLELIEQSLQRDEATLLQRILSPAEQCYFQRFKYMKRKKEWLGGRIAAKAAILALAFPHAAAVQYLRSITILPNKHGRPIAGEFPASLSALGNEPTLSLSLSLSLSHSDGFAVALAREGESCGIDLQEISTKLAGLTSHFATDAELQLLAQQTDSDEDTRLTMLWTVKEALKKSLLHDQSVIFSATELQEIAIVNDSVWHFTCTVQGETQSVLVHSLPPYILSITEDH